MEECIHGSVFSQSNNRKGKTIQFAHAHISDSDDLEDENMECGSAEQLDPLHLRITANAPRMIRWNQLHYLNWP